MVLASNPVESYQWMIDPFFTPCVLALCILAGFAGTAFLERAYLSPSDWRKMKGLLLLPALLPLLLNFHAADQSRYFCSYDYGLNELKTAAPGSLILCSGDIDLMPFYYLKDVKGFRKDVAYLTVWLIQYDWYQNAVFQRWPDLKIPALVPDSKTIALDLVRYKGNTRPFYFTNIFTPMWLLNPQNTIPEGFLWRMKTTLGLNFADDTKNANRLWGSYHLDSLDKSRGYWDDASTILMDSYGFALELNRSQVDRVEDADDHGVHGQCFRFRSQAGAGTLGNEHEFAFSGTSRLRPPQARVRCSPGCCRVAGSRR